MNNELPLTLCIFKCSFSPRRLLLLSCPSFKSRPDTNLIMITRERGSWMKTRLLPWWRPGKPRHRAEGDASWSSSQGGSGRAQVNTLKSSSWDRCGGRVGGGWGCHMTPPAIPSASPSAHTINSQSRKTNVTESKQHLCNNLKISSDFLLLFEWLSKDKRQTWDTILWDHVGSLIPYEPDRIMTENYSEWFSW